MAEFNPYGSRIAGLRKLKGLTQYELAWACGLSETGIAMIERGERIPGLGTAVNIADALGVTINRLVPHHT